MRVHIPVRLATASVLLVMGLCAWPRQAAAQSSVGSGPLTGTLGDTEPTTGVISLGRLKLAPGLTISELGWDDNVFDESAEEVPDEDYVASFTPDLSLYSRLRWVRLSAYGGSTLTYFREFDSENSVGYAWRGRADFLISRVRPFVAAGNTRSRTRPNGEIDIRPDRVEEEYSGGLAFDLGAHSLIYASGIYAANRFDNAVQDGIDLAETLSRESRSGQFGLKTDITPLLSVQIFASYQEDEFRTLPIRNSIAKSGNMIFRITPEAVATGQIALSYRDMHFADPGLRPYRGVLGSAALAYPFMEIGRFTLIAQRGVEYSLDNSEGYYIENSASLAYTHRLFGQVDVQGKVSRSAFDYSARPTEPAHVDTYDSAAGSLGYNLRNRTRVAVNYEYSRRRSPAFSARNYQRRRAFLSWIFAF
ncbi:MAG TPA: outer membrane beta-barrel protein [Vicinamibacterales bacterium]|nr:outer membrane beta-barrel protein [Vicinamibacterales bacterium]